MSSHHIIRDQQEPAVLIHKIDQFPRRVLHTLLEWSPIVLCCEPSINVYTQQGLKLDVALVNHLNYDAWKKQLKAQYPIKIMAIQDSDFLSTGLTLLRKHNQKAVNIVSDEMALFEIIRDCMHWVPEFSIVIITETNRHVLYSTLIYRKWLPSGSALTITPLSEKPTFSASGFHVNLNKEVLKKSVVLTKSRDGVAVIEGNRGPFLVSESLE